MIGRITFAPHEDHTCPECMRGLPCFDPDTGDRRWKSAQPSLSAAVAAVIERAKREPDPHASEVQ